MRQALRLIPILALAVPVSAAAVVQPLSRQEERISTLPRRAEPAIPAPRPEAWQTFRARHGDWRASWPGRGGAPHMAVGPPIALVDAPVDAQGVDRGVRRFVVSHPELFGVPTLDLIRCVKAGEIWYVSYRQNLRGVPVLLEDWEFRVNRQGGLMAFRAAQGVDARVGTRPRIDAAEARERARASLGLPHSTARLEGGEELYLAALDGGEMRLVRQVTARTIWPPAHWMVLVDAVDGRSLWRHDRVRYAVSGTVTAEVHVDHPFDPLMARPLRDQHVTVGPATAVTSTLGEYSAPATGSVTVGMQLSGPFCDVIHSENPDASFSTTVSDPADVSLQWSDANSQAAERDAFYHVNRVHAELKAIDPGFTGNDYAMPATVNLGANCNAFWDGVGVNFFIAGNGCANTGEMPDVIYHEYGHGVNDNLYLQAGSGIGMSNGTLHEGLSDVLSAFMQDNPIMGKGFYGPGTHLRTIDNTLRWPDDATPDPHFNGLIIGGALWDLREVIGLATASRLSHFAKYGIPDDFDDGVAMAEFFVEVLIADDDDGNLSNGTPHATAIADAFNAHGIGTGSLLSIGHAPPGDQGGSGPYPLYALFDNASPLGTMVPGSQRIHFSVNGSPYASTSMTATGSGGEHVVMLDVPEGSIVRYYFDVEDSYGGRRVEPPLGASDPHLFLAGSYNAHLIHDHESNAGGSVGFPGDGASSGLWEWAEPTGVNLGGVYSQPEIDHSQSGILCYVTGNGLVGYPPGAFDVDDGATTLLTGVLDLTGAGPNPVIEYYRWYTNHFGNAPFEDSWRVYMTGDGGIGWSLVESSNLGSAAWKRVVFFASDYITPSDLTRLRFVAEDAGEPSLVEAAVDDFRILYFINPALAVGPDPPVSPPRISASPNPSAGETRIDFRVPAEGPVTVALYDVAGRLVRNLFEGSPGPGPRSVRWDGRDRHGAPVANGLYLARMSAGGSNVVCRIARTR